MSKFSIDYERTVMMALPPDGGSALVEVWEEPPAGCSYTSAIKMMHERTLELAQMLETIINVLPELPVVNIPKGQRPGSGGFKP